MAELREDQRGHEHWHEPHGLMRDGFGRWHDMHGRWRDDAGVWHYPDGVERPHFFDELLNAIIASHETKEASNG